jgi:hypothetical protein
MYIHVHVIQNNTHDSQEQALLSLLPLQFVTGGTNHGL